LAAVDEMDEAYIDYNLAILAHWFWILDTDEIDR
jgi:hypothetical protein